MSPPAIARRSGGRKSTLEAAERVVFVPGYGPGGAQAQHSLKELAGPAGNNTGVAGQLRHPPVAGPDAGPHERGCLADGPMCPKGDPS